MICAVGAAVLQIHQQWPHSKLEEWYWPQVVNKLQVSLVCLINSIVCWMDRAADELMDTVCWWKKWWVWCAHFIVITSINIFFAWRFIKRHSSSPRMLTASTTAQRRHVATVQQFTSYCKVHIHTYMYICIYVHIWLCLCVYIFVLRFGVQSLLLRRFHTEISHVRRVPRQMVRSFAHSSTVGGRANAMCAALFIFYEFQLLFWALNSKPIANEVWHIQYSYIHAEGAAGQGVDWISVRCVVRNKRDGRCTKATKSTEMSDFY